MGIKPGKENVVILLTSTCGQFGFLFGFLFVSCWVFFENSELLLGKCLIFLTFANWKVGYIGLMLEYLQKILFFTVY